MKIKIFTSFLVLITFGLSILNTTNNIQIVNAWTCDPAFDYGNTCKDTTGAARCKNSYIENCTPDGSLKRQITCSTDGSGGFIDRDGCVIGATPDKNENNTPTCKMGEHPKGSICVKDAKDETGSDPAIGNSNKAVNNEGQTIDRSVANENASNNGGSGGQGGTTNQDVLDACLAAITTLSEEARERAQARCREQAENTFVSGSAGNATTNSANLEECLTNISTDLPQAEQEAAGIACLEQFGQVTVTGENSDVGLIPEAMGHGRVCSDSSCTHFTTDSINISCNGASIDTFVLADEPAGGIDTGRDMVYQCVIQNNAYKWNFVRYIESEDQGETNNTCPQQVNCTGGTGTFVEQDGNFCTYSGGGNTANAAISNPQDACLILFPQPTSLSCNPATSCTGLRANLVSSSSQSCTYSVVDEESGEELTNNFTVTPVESNQSSQICPKMDAFRPLSMNFIQNLLIPKVSAQESAPTPDTIDPSDLESGAYTIEVPGYRNVVINVYSNKVKVKYFEDLNGDGKKQANEKYLDPKEFSIKVASKDKLFTYEFETGWNLIGLKFINPNLDSARELTKTLYRQGIPAVQVSKYDNGNWVHFVYRLDEDNKEVVFGNDFTLVPGEGYFVRTLEPGIASLKGKEFQSSVPISISIGWNLISIQATKEYTAKSFLDFCKAEGLNCSELSKYLDGSYKSVVEQNGTTFGNDFDLLDNEGYFVKNGSGNKIINP